jgi:hypothetical protein
LSLNTVNLNIFLLYLLPLQHGPRMSRSSASSSCYPRLWHTKLAHDSSRLIQSFVESSDLQIDALLFNICLPSSFSFFLFVSVYLVYLVTNAIYMHRWEVRLCPHLYHKFILFKRQFCYGRLIVSLMIILQVAVQILVFI